MTAPDTPTASDGAAVKPSSTEDASRADVGLVCALSMELNHFFDRCERVRTIQASGCRIRGGRLNAIRIAAAESGPGLAKAARATAVLVGGHRPAWVVSCGFAGALREDIAVGDIVVASSVVNEGGDDITTPHGMSSDLKHGLHVGRFVSTDRVIRTVAEKQELASRFDAIACDMETFAVARECRELKIPFMAVRAITDDLSADLPAEVHALIASTGAGRLGATIGALWNRPESVKDLWKLREHAAVAARRLAPFLASVVEQLHAAAPKRDV